MILRELLPYALPVALSPLPAIAAIMIVLAPAGMEGGAGFLAGRVLTLFLLLLLVGSGAAALGWGAGPERPWLRIGFGLLALAVAALVWARRPKGGTIEPPRWMRAIDTLSPLGALRFGAVLTLINVKELAFVLGAAVALAGLAAPRGAAFAAALGFALFGSLGAGLPLLLLGAGLSRARLEKVRRWLLRHNSLLIAGVLLVIGLRLLAKGLSGL